MSRRSHLLTHSLLPTQALLPQQCCQLSTSATPRLYLTPGSLLTFSSESPKATSPQAPGDDTKRQQEIQGVVEAASAQPPLK